MSWTFYLAPPNPIMATAMSIRPQRHCQRARVFDDVTLVQYYEKYKVCKMEQLPAYARRL
eukprot:COSAG01_NODE_38363_length_490_cov_2.166240_1_plen_59_part_10